MRNRAVGAHAAGVGAGVALAQPLVVLRRGQQLDLVPLVIARTESSSPSMNSSITTTRPGVAESTFVRAWRATALRGLRPGGADDGALAGRETRGLHHQRLGVAVHVRQRRVQIGEGPARGGRHARPAASLPWRRPSRPRSAPPAAPGPKTGRPSARSRSASPSASGSSGPTTVRSMPYASAASARRSMSVAAMCEIGGEFGGAGVARGAVEVGGGMVAAEGPAEGVLAAPAADDQYPHDLAAPCGTPRPRLLGRLLGGVDHLVRPSPGLPRRSGPGRREVVLERPVLRPRGPRRMYSPRRIRS